MSFVTAIARPLRRRPLRLAVTHRAGEAPLQSDTGLTDLLGIADAESYDARDAWAPRPHRSRLRVPIGTGADGQPVELDLKESAQDGMGPHGLLIGKPIYTWPGLLIVLAGIPVYFVWRLRAGRSAVVDVR